MLSQHKQKAKQKEEKIMCVWEKLKKMKEKKIVSKHFQPIMFYE